MCSFMLVALSPECLHLARVTDHRLRSADRRLIIRSTLEVEHRPTVEKRPLAVDNLDLLRPHLDRPFAGAPSSLR